MNNFTYFGLFCIVLLVIVIIVILVYNVISRRTLNRTIQQLANKINGNGTEDKFKECLKIIEMNKNREENKK